METLPQNSYQYLNLNTFDYKYTLSQTTFDLSNAISDLCPVEEQRNLKKKDKSVISTSTVADKKKKKQNKNNKKKVKEEVVDLRLSKQDSKNGIFNIKITKDKAKGKESKKNATKLKQQQQHLLNQAVGIAMNILKQEVPNDNNEFEINTSIPHNQNEASVNVSKKENKKGKKGKGKQPIIQRSKEDNDTMVEGNKKVDDFIKSIKAKKEKQEKEKMKESLKIQFVNKYKYLFSLDPANRLRLRNAQSKIEPDVINDLFTMLSSTTITSLEKDQVKDICVLIDCIAEILIQTKETNKALISIYTTKLPEFILNQYSSINNELVVMLILNALYSMIKIKTENLIEGTNSQLIEQSESKLKEQIELISVEHNLLFENSTDLTNELMINYMIKMIYGVSDSFESLIQSLIEKIVLIFKKDYEYESNSHKVAELFSELKEKYSSLKFILKFHALFDLKKDLFYSLSIKISKALEAFFSQLQQTIIQKQAKHYISFMTSIILKYLEVFPYFYNLDNKFYEEVFNLLKLICENESYNTCLTDKYEFVKNVKISSFNFTNDDTLIKYILFIMKIFKVFKVEDKETKCDEVYLEYYMKVLEFIFDIKQSYLKDKYQTLLQREIDSKLSIGNINNLLFSTILSKIEKILKREKQANLVKLIHELKNFILFFNKNSSLKEQAITFIKKDDNYTLEKQIYVLFLFNFVDIKKDKEEILQLPITKVLSINVDLLNFLLHYYIDEEIEKLGQITELFLKEQKEQFEKELTNKLINNITEKNTYALIKDIKSFEKYDIAIPIESIINLRADDNALIVDSIVLYYINKSKEIKENIKSKYPYDIDFEKEIQEVNDKKQKYSKEYFNKEKVSSLLSVLLEIKKVDNLLVDNADYFKMDDIVIEGEESKENYKKHKANIDLILQIFNSILSIKDFTTLKESSSSNIEYILLFSQIGEFILNTLSNDNLFKLLTPSAELLSSFMKKYISFKDIFIQLRNESNASLKTISESESTDELPLLHDNLKISQEIEKISICSKCEDIISNLIVHRCSEQLVYLFPENEIFKLLLTNNRQFLRTVSASLNDIYKTQILNQEKIQSLLAKAQDENEDYLEDVIYEIFSKEAIDYLKNPKEIIDFLTTINEGMRYDLLPTKNKFYESIFPYFYIWKCIMSKIVNGFKLYTSDKGHITIIENYKTLLKFIINYLERESKLYEMFLLIVVSLLHLIDEQEYEKNYNNNDEIINNEKENLNSLDNFDEKTLTNDFDNNTYKFLLSILFRFVKIFPSLVKFYYDESKNKRKSIFKNLICSMILPKLLQDLRERIKNNEKILNDNQIYLKDFISNHYLEFYFSPIEEIKFSIEIKIPPIFPLKKLEINIKCNASIEERKLLNIKMNLNHTLNSSIDNISDNLIIWKEDVKQLIVAGNEPCPICYFYLHTTDKSLPSLYCHTCKKKFHGLCIKEWFKNLEMNGQDTTCPMCRSAWTLRK